MAGQISKGYTFGSTEQVTNAKLHSLVDSATITGVSNEDIASDAAIAYSKIADIDGSKLTGLANIPSNAGKIPAANITNTIDLTQIFPVGCIYLSTVATNPNTLFGFGTWTACAAGKMLLGNGGGYTAGNTGGGATKTISEANLPSHTHAAGTLTGGEHSHGTNMYTTQSGGTVHYTATISTLGFVNEVSTTSNSAGAVTGSTGAIGSGTAMDVMNPYLVVFMWERVS